MLITTGKPHQSRRRTYTPTAAVGVWPSAYCFVGVQHRPSAYYLAVGVRTWDPQDGVDGRSVSTLNADGNAVGVSVDVAASWHLEALYAHR